MDLSVLLGMKPWEKEIVEQGKVNVEDRGAWRGAGVVLNGVVRIVLTGEVRLSPFTPRGSQPSRHPGQDCFTQQKQESKVPGRRRTPGTSEEPGGNRHRNKEEE